MIIPILAAAGLAVAIGFYLSQSMGNEKKLIVDVLDVIDEQTLTVSVAGEKFRVVLAGIGFPPGDERARVDTFEIVKDVCLGKKLYMLVLKEIDGLKYVNIQSGSGDSLNELILKQGFARYESGGAGFVSNLVAAESEAKLKKIGIWDQHRALFKRISDLGDSVDHLNDAAETEDSYHRES